MIEAWFDGSCGPNNPGGTAAFGAFAKLGAEVVWEKSVVIGSGHGMTNNLAEHAGCLAILEWLIEFGGGRTRAVIFGDSKLVIEQIGGRWKIRRGSYVEMALRSRSVLTKFVVKPRFVWIPREQNKIADALSKAHLEMSVPTERELDMRHVAGLRASGLLF